MPEDPYGIAKRAVELDLEAAHRLFGLNYVVFRPHNVYGERQNTGDRYRNVIGIFMNQILRGEAMTIFGDGLQTRNFTYVGDVAPVIARIADQTGAFNRIYNIGSSEATPVGRLAELVAQAMGVEPNVCYLPERMEVKHAVASHERIAAEMGYAPKVSLEAGLDRMARWVRQEGSRSTPVFTGIEIDKNLPVAWRGNRSKDPADVRVSVVIINWNGREYLRSCLQALDKQTFDDFEAIVVDNGSTDGSIEMVKGSNLGIRLRVIENGRNLGFCAANNRGFAASRSPFIAMLNNDAEPEPGWLEALVGCFRGRPDVGMAASKILVWEDPRRIDKCGHLIYLDGQNRGRGSGEIDRGQYDRLEECSWPDGCAAMFRREVIEQIGGMDEDLFVFGDDSEFGLRARIAGWKCLYVPGAVVRHHRGGAVGVASVRRLYLIERNRVLLALKLFPWSLLWRNAAYYLLRVVAGMVAAARRRGEIAKYRGIRGKLRAVYALVKGDLVALWMAPRTLRKRREVRRIAKLTPGQVKELILQYRIPLRELSEGGN
jgi:GT2 family glycosyltransferase